MKKIFLFLFFMLMAISPSFSDCETTIDGHEVCDLDITDWYGISPAPATSNVGNARVYFDISSGKLKCSEDGGAFVNCVGSTAGFVTSVTGVSPISSTGGTTPAISIANAVADGSTKGAASFTASDFNSSSGNISIDYANGQVATSGQNGFLSSTDFTTFNNKISKDGSTTTTAPIPFAEGISLATTKSAFFGGTSSANSRAGISDDTARLNIQGYLKTSTPGEGADIRILAGAGRVSGSECNNGGFPRLKGGAKYSGGDCSGLLDGFTVIGTTMTSFTPLNLIASTQLANTVNDLGVEGNFYVATSATFSGGIGLGNRFAPTGYSILGDGDNNQIIGLDRTTSGAGKSLTIQGGWAQFSASNQPGGNLILAGGKSTGSGISNVIMQAVGVGGTKGNADNTPTTVATFGPTSLTFADPYSLVFGTTTGTKIGTSTSQKIGFFSVTPVIQPVATTDLGVLLSDLGLRAVGTAYPITTSGSVTLGSLTSTRIPIAGTAGLLGDDADLTFSTDTLTATQFKTNHVIGTSSTPGIAAGTGAGTTPTVSVTGTDIAGQVQVITGTLPTGTNAIIATITYASSYAYPNGSYVALYPANAITATLSGVSMVFAAGTTTTFVITSGTTALTAATTYLWNYLVLGR